MFKKIVFMGTSNFAVPILKSLYQNGYPISVVYTQPPKKSNRGQKFNKSAINNVHRAMIDTMSYLHLPHINKIKVTKTILNIDI